MSEKEPSQWLQPKPESLPKSENSWSKDKFISLEQLVDRVHPIEEYYAEQEAKMTEEMTRVFREKIQEGGGSFSETIPIKDEQSLEADYVALQNVAQSLPDLEFDMALLHNSNQRPEYPLSPA